MKTALCCATMRISFSIIPSRNPETAVSIVAETDGNYRWSARELTLMMLHQGTAIRTATATPHGATVAAETRTTCDKITTGRDSRLSADHPADYVGGHY